MASDRAGCRRGDLSNHQFGALPWIALALAFTFGFYGLLKKIAPLAPARADPGDRHSVSTSLGYLLFCESQGSAAFGHAS